MKNNTAKVFRDFAVPIVFLLILTAVMSLTNADLLLMRDFYSPTDGWTQKDARPWIDLYHFGNIPPLMLGLCGLALLILGFFVRRVASYRRVGLFLVVYLIVGPGLLINTVFKDNWGRPRPVAVKNFGGAENYRHVWEKGQAGAHKSFPSGHAAVGYFLFAPFFFLRKQHRLWAWFFLLLGLSYGTLMGIGRMAQGGHFASDVLWACGLTYLTGLALGYIFRFDKKLY